MESLEGETTMTGIHSLGRNDTFAQEHRSLSRLERRARRILSHDTAVEQRMGRIFTQSFLCLATHLANHRMRIVSRRRNHTENFACRGFDGDNRTQLAFHQPFTQGLQLDIDTQLQVFSWLRFGIILTILVVSLDTTVSIAQQKLDTFLSTQFFLIRAFYTQFADIIAWLIIVVILNIRLRHLCHIAQHMSSIAILILSDSASLDIKTWKTEKFLLKSTELLVGQLTHKQLLGETRIARILVTVFDFSHSLDEEVLRNVQRTTKLHRIQTVLLFVHDHHDVVSWLVIHQ